MTEKSEKKGNVTDAQDKPAVGVNYPSQNQPEQAPPGTTTDEDENARQFVPGPEEQAIAKARVTTTTRTDQVINDGK